MSKINATGKQSLPNILQNQQTDVNDNDSSHIICGKSIVDNTWTSDQIHVKGNLVIESPYVIPSPDHIISQDTSSSVYANNGGQISLNCSLPTQMGGQFIENCSPLYNNFILTHGKIGVNDAVNYYHFDIESAEWQCNGSGSQYETITLQCAVDIQQWSSEYQYAHAFDNSGILPNMIQPSGDAFIINPSLYGFMKMRFTTVCNYCFDGSVSVQDSSRILMCLFNKQTGEPIKQSMNFVCKNDQKHCYVNLSMEFWIQLDQSGHELIPCIQDYSGCTKFSWQPFTPQTFSVEYYPTFV